MLLVADVISAVILSYYRIKYIVEGDNIRSVLNNLDYVDKTLRSIGVKIPYAKDHITCAVVSILSMSVRLLSSYIFMRPIKPTSLLTKVTLEFETFSNKLAKSSLFYSVIVLEFYVTLILYVIRQRLTLLCLAIFSYNYLRSTAWDNNTTMMCIDVYVFPRSVDYVNNCV